MLITNSINASRQQLLRGVMIRDGEINSNALIAINIEEAREHYIELLSRVIYASFRT